MATVMKREWVYQGVKKSAWIVRYLDDRGSKRQKTFEKKKEAEAYRDRVKREINDGVHVANGATKTIAEVCEHFLRSAEDRLKDGRIGMGRYKQIGTLVRVSILPRLGAKLITELSPIDVEEWYRWMIREGKLCPQSAKDRVSNLRMIVDYAVRYKWVKINIVPQALKQLRGVKKKRIRTFTIDELQILIASLEKPRKHQRAYTHKLAQCFVHLAAFCGLRFGEIAGLTPQNVDLTRRVIRVRHSLTAFHELKGPKTRAGNRDVPLPSHVAVILREWMDLYARPNPQGLIFCTRTGAGITGATWGGEDWIAILRHAGLLEGDRLHFHALRHFCASWMIETGWSVTETAHHLGHASFDMTLSTYSHVVVSGNRRNDMMERTAQLALPQGVLTIEGAVSDARETQGL